MFLANRGSCERRFYEKVYFTNYITSDAEKRTKNTNKKLLLILFDLLLISAEILG